MKACRQIGKGSLPRKRRHALSLIMAVTAVAAIAVGAGLFALDRLLTRPERRLHAVRVRH